MGSAAPSGFCPFSPLMASSASILLSKRMNPTPRETPARGARASVSVPRTFSSDPAPWDPLFPSPTCGLVQQDSGSDDAPVLGEELLHLFLAHGLGKAADVQVGIPDGGRTGACIGHLGRGSEDSEGAWKLTRNVPTPTGGLWLRRWSPCVTIWFHPSTT